ncbi:unnamed protein product [Amoebophrya sp. A120]|nr:unnamed protein product [Amoebophrya sp. A120]|eukprot:GSA120T00021593001.1
MISEYPYGNLNPFGDPYSEIPLGVSTPCDMSSTADASAQGVLYIPQTCRTLPNPATAEGSAPRDTWFAAEAFTCHETLAWADGQKFTTSFQKTTGTGSLQVTVTYRLVLPDGATSVAPADVDLVCGTDGKSRFYLRGSRAGAGGVEVTLTPPAPAASTAANEYLSSRPDSCYLGEHITNRAMRTAPGNVGSACPGKTTMAKDEICNVAPAVVAPTLDIPLDEQTVFYALVERNMVRYQKPVPVYPVATTAVRYHCKAPVIGHGRLLRPFAPHPLAVSSAAVEIRAGRICDMRSFLHQFHALLDVGDCLFAPKTDLGAEAFQCVSTKTWKTAAREATYSLKLIPAFTVETTVTLSDALVAVACDDHTGQAELRRGSRRIISEPPVLRTCDVLLDGAVYGPKDMCPGESLVYPSATTASASSPTGERCGSPPDFAGKDVEALFYEREAATGVNGNGAQSWQVGVVAASQVRYECTATGPAPGKASDASAFYEIAAPCTLDPTIQVSISAALITPHASCLNPALPRLPDGAAAGSLHVCKHGPVEGNLMDAATGAVHRVEYVSHSAAGLQPPFSIAAPRLFLACQTNNVTTLVDAEGRELTILPPLSTTTTSTTTSTQTSTTTLTTTAQFDDPTVITLESGFAIGLANGIPPVACGKDLSTCVQFQNSLRLALAFTVGLAESAVALKSLQLDRRQRKLQDTSTRSSFAEVHLPEHQISRSMIMTASKEEAAARPASSPRQLTTITSDWKAVFDVTTVFSAASALRSAAEQPGAFLAQLSSNLGSAYSVAAATCLVAGLQMTNPQATSVVTVTPSTATPTTPSPATSGGGSSSGVAPSPAPTVGGPSTTDTSTSTASTGTGAGATTQAATDDDGVKISQLLFLLIIVGFSVLGLIIIVLMYLLCRFKRNLNWKEALVDLDVAAQRRSSRVVTVASRGPLGSRTSVASQKMHPGNTSLENIVRNSRLSLPREHLVDEEILSPAVELVEQTKSERESFQHAPPVSPLGQAFTEETEQKPKRPSTSSGMEESRLRARPPRKNKKAKKRVPDRDLSYQWTFLGRESENAREKSVNEALIRMIGDGDGKFGAQKQNANQKAELQEAQHGGNEERGSSLQGSSIKTGSQGQEDEKLLSPRLLQYLLAKRPEMSIIKTAPPKTKNAPAAPAADKIQPKSNLHKADGAKETKKQVAESAAGVVSAAKEEHIRGAAGQVQDEPEVVSESSMDLKTPRASTSGQSTPRSNRPPKRSAGIGRKAAIASSARSVSGRTKDKARARGAPKHITNYNSEPIELEKATIVGKVRGNLPIQNPSLDGALPAPDAETVRPGATPETKDTVESSSEHHFVL